MNRRPKIEKLLGSSCTFGDNYALNLVKSAASNRNFGAIASGYPTATSMNHYCPRV